MSTLPSNLALATIPDGSPIVAVDHRNNYSAIQTALNSLLAILGGGTAGQVLTSAGAAAVEWDPAAGGGTTIPAGTLTMYAGAAAPSGWLLCDGSAISRTTYSALFTAIGTSYGTGDGSTTFNLPDMRGRMPVGLGTHADVNALGDNDGSALASRRPKHNHTLKGGNNTNSPATPPNVQGTNAGPSSVTTAVGPQTGSEPLDAPAYLTVNFIVKT